MKKSIVNLGRVFFFLLALPSFLCAAEILPLSPAKQPVIKDTSKRSSIVLNGVWEFAPAVFPIDKRPAAGDWGSIRVPGFWRAPSSAPGIEKNPNTEIWKNYKIAAKAGWYKRQIEIPASWKKSAIVLYIDRVSTDARVYANGNFAGVIHNPSGEVDLTKFVSAGKTATIEILVCAFADKSNFDRMEKFSAADAAKAKPTNGRRGISSDVMLFARPKEAYIDGAFIRTSVRRMEVAADIEFRNVPFFGEGQIKIDILDKNGDVVKTFSKNADFEKTSLQKISVSDSWKNPIFWEIGKPNIYTMRISLLRDGKLLDCYKENFGFREFAVVGKDFHLNGKKVHLQPLHNFFEGDSGGSREAISNAIDAMMACNFNTMELWPWEQSNRQSDHSRPLWAKIADEKGFLIFYPAHGQYRFVNGKSGGDWGDKETKKWMEIADKQWREVRNSPSVVAFMTIPNAVSITDDNNPYRMGNNSRLNGNADWLERVNVARKMVSWLKQLDETRPVATHDGANNGDFHAMNNYLDFIPLQEREEWLSEWAYSGSIPYMAIEFGTPFICNFQRDRSNPYRAWQSEPLLVEFTAIYFGEKSYDMESQEYRDMISREYIKDLLWNKLVNLPEFEFAKLHSEFQGFYIKNTWRSWRTWGISGGMVPWRDAYGWKPKNGTVKLPFKDGALGWQPAQMNVRGYYGMSDKGTETTASGLSLIENMSPILMYIGGKPEAFTDKTHHFYGGTIISKQIVAINDSREEADYDFNWNIEVDGKKIGGGNVKGRAKVSERVFLPFSAELPQTSQKISGKIFVEGTFGGKKVSDTFLFSVYPNAEFKSPKNLYVFDPKGSTADFLSSKNVKFAKWDGSVKSGILVIGEDAFSYDIPGELSDFAENGGKILILGQSRKILKNIFGFRAGEHVARRMFPVASQKNHPLIAGLDAEDFRDWAGSGTLVPEIENIFHPTTVRPQTGYHWGNRGSVASATVEKPHFSSWRPILEGQFDLSFTPLMENEFGGGKVVFCALDIGGRTERDPVADLMFSRLLSYLDAYAPKSPKADSPAVYVGGERGAKFLKSVGMKFVEAKNLSSSGFAVVGENSGLSDDQIKAALDRGVNIVLIERAANGRFGLSLKDGKLGKSAAVVPQWEETAGISRSDVHTRTDIPSKLFVGGETGFGGAWAKIKGDKGVAVAFAILPDELDTNKFKYLRFTSWRMLRSFCQIAGNLGAFFVSDKWLLESRRNDIRSNKLSFNGYWRYAEEDSIKNGDPASPKFDDSQWSLLNLIGHIDEIGASKVPFKKNYWIRKNIFIPKDWKKSEGIKIWLGKIVGGDELFVNGKRVAATKKHPQSYLQERIYEIPFDAVVFGGNNIFALRVEPYSSGRVCWSSQVPLYLNAELGGQYSPDYIEDHPDGDNPFRYMKW